ncbi:MAG: tetratricopeptide repeat protein [Patescibacteria group bacterium]
MNKQNEIVLYLENVSLLILGVLFVCLPLFFLTLTTDAFTVPKQLLLAFVVLVCLILFSAKTISEGIVRIRRTPFDLPIFLFTLFALLSAIFAVNRFDSIISFTPLLFAIFAYFTITNLIKTKASISFLLYCLVIGAGIISIVAVFSFFKIYFLPFKAIQFQSFSPLGSLFDQAIYLIAVLPIAVHLALPILKVDSLKALDLKKIFAALFSILIIIGFSITLYQLLKIQAPLLLPFQTGFQTAFAAISQDTTRIATGFFLGSGFGTYATDFTRFKQAAFNLDQNIWSYTFFRSSSFVLELLATTGILGLLSYFFVVFRFFKTDGAKPKIKSNFFYISLLLLLILSFVLPFSFTILAFLFIVLGLFAAEEGTKETSGETQYYDIELKFTTSKNSIFPLSSTQIPYGLYGGVESSKEEKISIGLPVVFFILLVFISGVLGFYVIRYAASDIILKNSIDAANSNNGLETYNNQVSAIGIFPYRDSYFRIYSQTNLALANSLAAQQPKGSSPSAQTQQTIYTLIQQSINAARQAVTISPQTVSNWQNLSSVYRSLIGFGQNAESFAVTSELQAITLDPNNPQGYITLGGIYYQLGQWDDAQRQFQIAVNLKPDYANAYYNLGHALESKEDFTNALIQYQTVKNLLTSTKDKTSLKQINDEITALEQKIGSAKQNINANPQQQTTLQNQPPLGISTPSAKLPAQKPPVEIPAPETTVAPTVSPTNPTPAL